MVAEPVVVDSVTDCDVGYVPPVGEKDGVTTFNV
jgi:prolyl-tRNA editing enzyme YbaK/EbsC (Cys-tRNA(Pro) deacylase)